jgi:protein-S-isoprenylcysteine O-methyltransferase Ste14
VFVIFYHLQAIPGHEAHMAKKYGAEWTRYRENTPKYLFFR